MDLSALRRLVTCTKCECFLSSPIVLPCCNYICETHLDELKSKLEPDMIDCHICKQTHQIPENGFEKSANLIDVINSNVHLYDEERKTLKNFEKSLNDLENLVESLDQKHPETEIYIFNLISKVKNQIDLDVEKLKARIDDVASKLLSRIKSFEKKCYEVLQKIEKIDNLEAFLNEVKQQVNAHKRSTNLNTKCEKANRLKQDLENKIKKFETKLKEFETVKLTASRLIYKPLKESVFTEGQFLGELEEEMKKFKLITGSWDNTLNIWQNTDVPKVRKLEEHDGGILALTIMNTRKLIVSGYADNEIKFWSIKNNYQCIKTLNVHSCLKGCYSLLVAPDGELLSGFGDGTIKVFNLDTYECVKTFKEHFNTVYCIISLGLNQFASRSKDKSIKIWNLSGVVEKSIKIESSVNCTIVSNNKNNQLITGESNGSIKVWDIIAQNWTKTLVGHNSYIYSLEMTENDILISGDGKGYLFESLLLSNFNLILNPKLII
jgi:WD40 repeat protein